MTGISQCLIGMQWETDLIYVGLYYDNYLFGYDQLVKVTLLWSVLPTLSLQKCYLLKMSWWNGQCQQFLEN